MAINPFKLMKIKEQLRTFQQDHPRAVAFLRSLRDGEVQEGTILELKVIQPDGSERVTNIRLNRNDMETLGMLGGLKED